MFKFITKDVPPEKLPESVRETLATYKEKLREVDAMDEKTPEALAKLKVAAEELDLDLIASFAHETESDPKVKEYMKKHNYPEWDRIPHTELTA